MSADPYDVATAGRHWAATAAALHEAADRLAAQAPEVEERLRGRTGVVTAAALWRAVRALRADAEDAADGGAALADVAAALEEARLDPTDRARKHLALRMQEATRVMRRIHGPTTPPRPHQAVGASATAIAAATAIGVETAEGGQVRAGDVAATLGGGLLTARAVGAVRPRGTEGTAAPARAPGTTIPAGHGRSGCDRGSRDRRAHAAGIEEHWTDDDGAGPAVLGAG